MRRATKVVAAGLLLISFGLGSSAWADDTRILDMLLKKGLITQEEYDEYKRAAGYVEPSTKSKAEPAIPEQLQQKAIEAKKEADRQQVELDRLMVQEGRQKGWLGALKEGFTPSDTEYRDAPNRMANFFQIRRPERLGVHLHNIQLQYFDQPNLQPAPGTAKDEFKINVAELEVSGYLLPGLMYAQVVVDPRDTSGQGLAQSLHPYSATSQVQGNVRDAFADLVFREPEAVLRVGQQRIPFGLEPQIPGGLLPFINRSYMDLKVTRNPSANPNADVNQFSNAEYIQERDIGVQARGVILGGLFNYGIGVFNGSGINVNDTNNSKDIIGRIGFNPHPGFRTGFSLYQGTQLTNTRVSGVRNRYGGDLEITPDLIPRLHIVAEVVDGRDEGFHRFMWYAEAMFEVMPQATPTSPKFQLKYRFEEYLDNLGVGDNNYYRRTVGFDYYFLNAIKVSTGYWQQVKLQVEYEMRSHTASSATTYSQDTFAHDMIIAQLGIRY